jgi:hypothetical protein
VARLGLEAGLMPPRRAMSGHPISAITAKRDARRTAFEQVRAGAWRADCMSDEEWSSWLALNPTNLGLGVADRPCTDCPLGFAGEMRAEGRCNGSPGWQPPVDDVEEASVGEQITVTNVRIEAPCASCMHREVCGIRVSLGLLEADVMLPKLHSALSVVTALQVECSHYRRDGKGSAAGRKLNLSDEERARRRDRIIAAGAARRASIPDEAAS